jgi:hypothetical protein
VLSAAALPIAQPLLLLLLLLNCLLMHCMLQHSRCCSASP